MREPWVPGQTSFLLEIVNLVRPERLLKLLRLDIRALSIGDSGR
jgi:hypothetical protein